MTKKPKRHKKKLHWHFCVTVFTVCLCFLATDSYEIGKQKFDGQTTCMILCDMQHFNPIITYLLLYM
jgi:hypothetical protein